MIRILPRSFGWLLLPVVILAGVLRFEALIQRGLLYWDEGKFALEGMRILSVLASFPAISPALLAGKAIGTAKPGHALFIAFSYVLFGEHDYAPLLMNATFSVLAIVVLFLLARYWFDTRVALLAAGLQAVAGYDIVYARSALSESDANLVFLVGMLLWSIACKPVSRAADRTRQPWIATGCAAIVMGAAFTVNYRLLVFIAVIVAVDLVRRLRQSQLHVVAGAMALWAVGLSLLPLVWQVTGLLFQQHGIVLFRSEIDYLPTSYVREVLYQLHGGKQSVLRFDAMSYLQWYVYRQGWIAFAFLLLGLASAAYERSKRWTVPTALVLIPYGVYVFAPFIVPRNLAAALPFAAVLSAAALVRLIERIRTPRARAIVGTGATALALLVGSLQAWPLTTVRSGFAQAATYLQQHDSQGAIVESEIMRFYLRDAGRGCDAPRLPSEVASLAQDEWVGGDYAVVDQYFYPTALYLARHARVVARFRTNGTVALNEDLVASEDGVPPAIQHTHFVDVYALDSVRLSARRPARHIIAFDGLAAPKHSLVRTQVCSLDRLP